MHLSIKKYKETSAYPLTSAGIMALRRRKEQEQKMVASYGKQKPGYAFEAVNAPAESRPYSQTRQRDHSCFQVYHPHTGRGWWLKPGENTIGRGFDNDVVVTDLSISRHHARIYVDGPNVYIRDSGSTNGVIVAGQKVKDSVLTLDCIFKLGKVELAIIRPVADTGSRHNWMMTWD